MGLQVSKGRCWTGEDVGWGQSTNSQDGNRVRVLRQGFGEYTRALQQLLGGVRSRGLPAQALQLQLSPCRVHGAYKGFQGH